MRCGGGAVGTIGACLALGVCGGTAGAASVVVIQESANKGPPPPSFVRFNPNAGEANAVTVTLDGGVYTFTDRGALLRAQSGCTQVDPFTASCRATNLQVALGDGNDSLLAPYGQRITGDAGDDTIEAGGWIDAGEGDDIVRGGPADDFIELGPGRDKGSGGAGDDQFGVFFSPPMRLDTAAEPDEYDGGPGRDGVSYLSRRYRIEFDLVAGLSGEDREDDRLVDIEDGSISSFGELVGDGAANTLSSAGRALFAAGGGDDHLFAFSRGQDAIDAGAGDDVVELTTAWAFQRQLPRRDQIRCGPGTDRVGLPAPNTIVPIDCEGATFAYASGPRIQLRRGLAVVTGGDCASSQHTRCRVRATVQRVRRADANDIPELGATIATESVVFRKGSRRLVLRPNAEGRALLNGRGCRLLNLTVFGLGYGPDQRVLFDVGRGCRPRAPVRG